MTEGDKWEKRFERERKARKEAEQILEKKSYELYESSLELKALNTSLEDLVAERTKALEMSEHRFRFLVESATEIIYRLNPEGFFSYINPVGLNSLGYEENECQEKYFSELVAPSHREKVTKFYLDQIANNKSTSYLEFPAITKSGKVFWLGQNVSILFDEKDQPTFIAAVARDLTEAKIAKSRLENLIMNMQSGILLENENRQIVITNQQFCDMFGVPAKPEQMVGADCSQSAKQSKALFENEVAFEKRIEEILLRQELVLNDLLKMKDGRTFERDYIPIFLEGQHSGHMWNYRDVTDLYNGLEVLRISEEKYRSIIQNMNLGLIEVDLDERIQYANQSFERMSGFEKKELIDRSAPALFLRGENVEEMAQRNAQRKKGETDAYEVTVKNKRGEVKWWLISGAPLKDNQGKVTGSIGIHLDITTQKILEQQLIEAKMIAENSAKSKEAFLANMSHEIRTPMNGIMGMTAMLSKTNLDEHQQFQLGTIKAASENLLVIINDVLDLSKMEAGKLEIYNEPFHFEKTLNQAIEILKPKVAEKSLRLNCTIDDSISKRLIGDPYRLNQILLNVLGNSVKFTEKGSINLSAELKSEADEIQTVEISVRDEGIGMDQSFLDSLFQKFTQEDGSNVRKSGGTGLGMNITKNLVSLLGGEIAVQSAKGLGTLVKISLPFGLDTTDHKAEDIVTEQLDYSILKGVKVLCAEDNELNQFVVESVLGQYQLEVTFAENGLKAIDACSASDFDIVLMDIQMPELDGVEATQIIRSDLKKTVPIVALTANVIEQDRDRFEQAGMNDCLGKPFREEELLRVIYKWTIGNELSESEETDLSSEDDSQPLFSMEKLQEIARGNEDFIDRMKNTFVQQSEKTSIEVLEALEAKDYVRISKLAHKIKPSIEMLKINAMTAEVKLLEACVNESLAHDEIERLVNHFATVLNRVISKLISEK
jgi:PAS domain S-box-containing protein